MNQYQAQCKKLPKALREWPAYNDCKKTIDDFLEMLPLFQALTSKAMRERHWKDLMSITGGLLTYLLCWLAPWLWRSARPACQTDTTCQVLSWCFT